MVTQAQRRQQQKAMDAALHDTADYLRRLITEARQDGKHWNEIAKITGLPAYCCMVIAGEIRGNRKSRD